MDRIDQEIEILKRAAGTRSAVLRGRKTVDRICYTGVLVKNMRLAPEKFGGTTVADLLFLLPPRYPSLPPIGCYLNYKYPSADHHFTQAAHYGAPSLINEGWYWYCLGLGGGFTADAWVATWHPCRDPGLGHNLGTLFIMAKHGINTNAA